MTRATECLLLTILSIIAALIITVSLAKITRAHDYQHPDLDDWYASLMQPDALNVSCCGKADAYFTDMTETDTDGALLAVITDDREIPNRPNMNGKRIRVPVGKIRKRYSPNPTGHGIIFMSPQGSVYCYEPQPLI